MFKSECTVTFETSVVMQTAHEANSFHSSIPTLFLHLITLTV